MSATNRAFRRRVRAWQRAQRRGYRWRVLTPRIVMNEVAPLLLSSFQWGVMPVAVPKPDRRKA